MAVAVLAAPVAALSFPPPVHPAEIEGPRDCTPVKGTFTNVFLMGRMACPDSLIFQCTQGQLSGDLLGTYSFNFSAQETVGVGDAAVARFTGESTVTTAEGTFSGEDFGILRLNSFPLAAFTTHLRIQSGTGAYEGATGHLTIQGAASFVTAAGAGTYHGVICLPRAGDETPGA